MSSAIITTERLVLREWLDSDLEPFAAMNKDEDVMQFFPARLTREETMESVNRIKAHFKKNHFGLYAVENKLKSGFMGFTGFSIPAFESFFTPCVEIGWRFKKEVWGQGYATEAALACIHFGFDVLKFDKIMSFTSVLNIKSENVIKRIGMQHAGNFEHPYINKDNKLCRHVLYQLTTA